MLRQVGPFGSVKVAGHLLRRLWLDFLLAGLLCGLSVPLNPQLAGKLAPEVVLPIWGIAVSVFVGFRHNQAYERWWEARKLWGALLNHSRKWRDALLALLAVEASSPLRQPLLQAQVQLVWLINAELRGQGRGRLEPHLSWALTQFPGPGLSADGVLQQQATAIERLHASGAIDGLGRLQLLAVHGDICDALGGLERIRNHPLPAPYDVFVRVAVWSFGYLLFLAMDARFAPYGGWVAVVVMLLFIAVERFGAFVESPFAPADLALPMNRICAAISGLLLSEAHPLARLPQSEASRVWT